MPSARSLERGRQLHGDPAQGCGEEDDAGAGRHVATLREVVRHDAEGQPRAGDLAGGRSVEPGKGRHDDQIVTTRETIRDIHDARRSGQAAQRALQNAVGSPDDGGRIALALAQPLVVRRPALVNGAEAAGTRSVALSDYRAPGGLLQRPEHVAGWPFYAGTGGKEAEGWR